MMHDFAKNGKKKRRIVNTIRRFMDSKGVEPSTFRMRTERSPNSLAFVHTLCTMRKEKINVYSSI